MAFKNERFPVDISLGAIGGLAWRTEIGAVDNDNESRNQGVEQPLGRWEVGHNARKASRYERVRAHAYVMAGKKHSFPFKDWTDFTVGTGDGVFVQIDSTHFQTYKRYTSGSQTFDRMIWLPRNPIVVTGGTVASISYTTGIVTMTGGTPTAWTGEFDCLARYDVDRIEAHIIDKSGGELVIGAPGIPIAELRRP